MLNSRELREYHPRAKQEEGMVSVDWRDALELIDARPSTLEEALVRLDQALADGEEDEHGVPVDAILREIVDADTSEGALVIDAFEHASQWIRDTCEAVEHARDLVQARDIIMLSTSNPWTVDGCVKVEYVDNVRNVLLDMLIAVGAFQSTEVRNAADKFADDAGRRIAEQFGLDHDAVVGVLAGVWNESGMADV